MKSLETTPEVAPVVERGRRALQIACWLAAIALIVWGNVDARFRDAEGFLRGGYCLPMVMGVAFIFLGWAVSSNWKESAAWLALAVVGQAVALQMIDAGQLIRYQHYRPIPRLLESSPWLLVCLAAQTGLVAGGLRAHWATIQAWLGRNFRAWQLIGVGLAFFVTSATVSRDVWVYLMELPFAAFVQTANLANLVLAVWALPEAALARLKSWCESLDRRLEGTVGRVDRLALLAAIWVTTLAAILNIASYQRHPHVGDEVAYLYHARYLAAGMLTMPVPPVPEAFTLGLMDYDATRWFCAPQPGWPAVLMLGVLGGVPWLVNPLLAGLNVLLAHALLREIYDRRTALLGVLLLCVSPWHILMAMSFMTHTVTLTCALGAAVAIVVARRTGRAGWAALGGAATGMVGLIRPLDGLVVAGLLGLWILGVGGRRLKVTCVAAWVLGCAILGGATLGYNKLLTGNAATFPIMALTDKYRGPNSNAFGFGADRGMGWAMDPSPGHGPFDAMVNANLNIFSINIELFGWSAGSLILIALLMFLGPLRRGDRQMLAVIAAVFAVHFFYWYSGGPDFGARYWYLMLIPCVALSARGMQILEGRLEHDPGGSPLNGVRIRALVLSLCALTLVNYFPWRAIDKYHHYLRMRPDIRRLAEEHHFGKSLVLIQGRRFPDYASAAIYNPIDLHADAPVYAWDKMPEIRAQVLNAYADRPVWIIAGPSITKGGFKVLEGPLPARELLAREPAGAALHLKQP